MKKYRLVLCTALCSLVLSASPAFSSEVKIGGDKNVETVLSIYNNNLAFVKDTRRIELPAGKSVIAFEGVASRIKAETAMLLGKDITVLEQNYDYNLLTPANILEESVGETVKTAVTDPETGKDIFDTAEIVTSNYGSPVLKFSYGYETKFPGRIIYNRLPDNLRTQPTLVISLNNKQTGNQDLELAYLTNGISWKTDYIAEITGKNELTLNGWVTLQNNSGTDYKDAKVQLIAGNINQINPAPDIQPRNMMLAKGMADAVAVESTAVPSREALSDYYLYTLPNTTTIKDKQTKQVNLMTKNQVKFSKEYKLISPFYLNLYTNSDEFTRENPNVIFKIANNADSHLGEPLPGGIIRLYQNDKSGNLQFIGENKIEHTAVNEKIELETGKAFDITVSGKITKNEPLGKDIREFAVEVKFENAKDEISEIVFEQDFGNTVSLLSENIRSESKNANTRVWRFNLEPHSDQTLTFSVRISGKQ